MERVMRGAGVQGNGKPKIFKYFNYSHIRRIKKSAHPIDPNV